MPVIEIRTNTALLCQQRYTRQTLLPGTHTLINGMCMGLTVAWLKKMQLGYPLLTLPTHMEGLIGHHRYRQPEKKESSGLSADVVSYKKIESFCQLQGFQTDVPSFKIACQMDTLVSDSTRSPNQTTTYLLCISDHVIGLALRAGTIALFDSNKGVYVFTNEKMMLESTLTSVLNTYLLAYQEFMFKVVKLKY